MLGSVWHCDTGTTSALMGFLHVSNTEKGPLWYVVIARHFGLSVFQVMATSRGRSWRTSSGSWRWLGEEQAWWVQGPEIEHMYPYWQLRLYLYWVQMFFQDPSNPTFREKMKEFMQKFDKNKDGRIEMSEVRPSRCFLYHDWKPVIFINGIVLHSEKYLNC